MSGGDKDILQARLSAITTRFYSNLRYNIEMATLIVANKTTRDIMFTVDKTLEKLKNNNVNAIIETESALAMNMGRRRVGDEHK